MLNAIAVTILAAAVAGLAHILTERRAFLILCYVISGCAVLFQVALLVQAGLVLHSCVLHAAWGVMGVAVIAGILACGWAGHHYQSPRLSVGGLVGVLLFVLVGNAILTPLPDSSQEKMNWVLSAHIVLGVAGLSALALGCVAGALFLIRSRLLKSKTRSAHSDIPWPALTALDRLFTHSAGIGVLLLAGGVLLGLLTIHHSSPDSPWYTDPRSILTVLGCLLYGVVWFFRKRRGFCSRRLVGLGTLGFVLVILGFLAPGIFTQGFHLF